MFVKNVNKCVKWISVNLACATMVFSPVALGREAEKLTEQSLKTYLQEFGLTGKKITVGEFWEKTRMYYPASVYKEIEAFVAENKNVAMPDMKVTTAKATDGAVVPVLQIATGSKLTTIQIFGEEKKWAKYNNVNLTEQELQNGNQAYNRVVAGDAALKKEVEAHIKDRSTKATQRMQTMIKDFARFQGFQRMTPEQWKTMTPEQRAGFIVNMRLLWQDARQVLRLEEISASKNKSSKGRKFSSFEEFSKILLGEEADAADPKPGLNGSRNKVQLSETRQSVVQSGAASAPAAPQAKKCIVLGLVSEEGPGVNYRGETISCSEDMVYKSEKYNANTPAMKMVRDARAECKTVSQNMAACNPLLYGYESNGSAICVDRTKTLPSSPPVGNYQKATWWDGPCDSASRLTSSQIQDGMKTTDASYAEDQKRFDENGKIKAEVAQQQINMIEEDQFKNNSYDRTKSYLDSVLQNKKRSSQKIDFTMDDLISGKVPWSKDIDDMLVDTQSYFETEIADAIQSCEKSVARKDNVDTNQKGACDQLHRRWLFTERFLSQFRAKSCAPGSTYVWALDNLVMSKDQIDRAKRNKEKVNSDELLCRCDNDRTKKTKFNDAKGCGSVAPPSTVPQCPEGFEKRGDDCACAGKENAFPAQIAIDRLAKEGYDALCVVAPSVEQKCGKPDGIAGFDYDKCECTKGKLKDENEPGFISKIFNSNAEKKEAKWVCDESSIWPWVLGGVGLIALLALLNRSKSKSKPPVVTGGMCPDGVTKYVDILTSCPKCADGSYRSASSTARPGGCPTTTEGGSGSATCANPPCSGGVPTAQ